MGHQSPVAGPRLTAKNGSLGVYGLKLQAQLAERRLICHPKAAVTQRRSAAKHTDFCHERRREGEREVCVCVCVCVRVN